MSLTIGVDVGGTKIAAGVVDEHGGVLAELRVESPATDARGDRGGDRRARGSGCGPATTSTAVGVGAAGYVDRTRSVVLFAPNLAWRDAALKADLEAAHRACRW